LTAQLDILGAELAQGAPADALLRSAVFQKAWTELAAACPWATAYQSWAFAEAWLSVYSELYETLLVYQRDKSGKLIGLLPLAIEGATGALVHVGAHQAEYQVWLASESNADLFIEQALDLLVLHYPGQLLRLKYLPPGSPLGWRGPGRRWRRSSILREHRRPLLAAGANSTVENTLRKKANRNRINRLKRIGELTLVHMQTRAELECVFDTVADFYDLRQGAISSSTPFRDDPRKKEFTLRLLEKPGLAHASVLMLGDTPVAANIGLVSPPFVSLGVIGHSPFYADSSPGKMHILLLARQLGQQGFRGIDLTPGGGTYKDQLADHADQAYVLSVHFDRVTLAWEASKTNIRAALERVLGDKAKVLASHMRSIASAPVGSLLANTACSGFGSSRRSKRYYTMSPGRAKQCVAGTIFRVNSISDLLLYRPVTKSDRSRKTFFDYVSRRLEAGDRVYTLTKNGVLLHFAWLRYPAGAIRMGLDESVRYPQNACLVWDDYTHPQADRCELKKLSLAQMLHDAARIPGVETILVAVGPDENFSS
jgi:CelD/BcsL family acetyltransferase involved in cellulose biosynthesis